jgi:pseudouridine-5'-phosphate glycosidase
VKLVRVEPTVAAALEGGLPVVALESALITHGFSYPANVTIAEGLEAAVREEGALPATIGVLDGEPWVGLSDQERERLAKPPGSDNASAEHLDEKHSKISLRDLPIAVAQRRTGGTTVAATMHLAHRAGIQVLATGGIGGVHRGHPEDVSADLTALGSIPLTVVSSGAKAILDLPRTLEQLESRGVPVVGYGSDQFPAFYSRASGLGVDAVAGGPEDVARLAWARDALGTRSAILVCAPVPEPAELPAADAEKAIRRAMEEAGAQGITGKALTPFLLARVVELTDGAAQRANEALLIHNARVAARIAQALEARQRNN